MLCEGVFFWRKKTLFFEWNKNILKRLLYFFTLLPPKAQYHRKKIIKYGNIKIIFTLTIWFYAPHLGSFEIAEDNHQPVFHLVLRYKVHQALTNILLRKENQYYPSLNNYNDTEDKYKTVFHLVWHKVHQHKA